MCRKPECVFYCLLSLEEQTPPNDILLPSITLCIMCIQGIIYQLLTNWFWYAVTAINTVSGKINVLNSSASKLVMDD